MRMCDEPAGFVYRARRGTKTTFPHTTKKPTQPSQNRAKPSHGNTEAPPGAPFLAAPVLVKRYASPSAGLSLAVLDQTASMFVSLPRIRLFFFFTHKVYALVYRTMHRTRGCRCRASAESKVPHVRYNQQDKPKIKLKNVRARFQFTPAACSRYVSTHLHPTVFGPKPFRRGQGPCLLSTRHGRHLLDWSFGHHGLRKQKKHTTPPPLPSLNTCIQSREFSPLFGLSKYRTS